MADGRDRLAGGLLGLVVGDAVGVPYELHARAGLPHPDEIDILPPPGFRRAHPLAPPGAWSDDGAQALCLLASLLDCGRLDPDDLGRRLVDWWRRGYAAVDGVVFDCGFTTRRALHAIERGVPASQAGETGEMSNGNGSLMRVLPLALWHAGSDEELVADARLQSRVTHGHLRSQLCCALYCLWARRTLQGRPAAWEDAVATLRRLHADDPAAMAEIEGSMRVDHPPGGRGTGYVVDCLHSARWALWAGTFEGTVKAAISLGEDTDTTAAVAGGIGGILHGAAAIPPRWLSRLGGRDILDPLVHRLLEHHAR